MKSNHKHDYVIYRVTYRAKTGEYGVDRVHCSICHVRPSYKAHKKVKRKVTDIYPISREDYITLTEHHKAFSAKTN